MRIASGTDAKASADVSIEPADINLTFL